MKKTLFLLAVIAIAVVFFWKPSASDKPSLLSVSGPFEFSSQDLSKDGFLFSRLQVVEALIGINDQAQPYPLLAQSWQQSEDGLRWVFEIRPNVLFHDGQPLTAQAVVHSLSRAVNKPGVIRQVPIESITAENEALVIILQRPYRPLLSVLAHYSTAIISPSSYHENGHVNRLQGTGPYQIDQLQAPHKAQVMRFDRYWGTPAAIEKVEYLTGHRSESRALLAQTGQADIVYTLDPISIPALQQAKNVQLHIESIPRTVLIKVNNAHPFLSHKSVRQALSFALDRQGMAESVLRLPQSHAYQLFSPALGSWHLPTLSGEQRQLEKAQQLLTDQGWQKNAQGFLEKSGEVFRVQLLTYADRPELPLLATAIQAQWRELGIDVQISIDNSSAIPAKHHDNSLELALIARNFGTLADPLPLLMEDFATEKGSDWGPMHWSSDLFSQQLDLLVTESDPEKYEQLAQQAAHILADEMPLIPVTYYQQIIAVNRQIHGFSFDPFEINYRLSEMKFHD
ncbi:MULTISPECIES: ABC transporter substrate-binding protein [unclassified Vibrio]|uniref:ABC transporter substrate-binding protein n=1 Tax=unclassified Vibrio TaxID=2614977 RepID=UPI0014838E71|nr:MULTISPECIES: ABC transporter substrate-binding protein [unclassified Vibrio]NNN43518.1 ABC transporter substrate-binding protein [Vibrio sp. 1-1(7)]NNN71342.1 ABC transporter substrate-binding protein [Vibrio sp. 12-2(3-a)]